MTPAKLVIVVTLGCSLTGCEAWRLERAAYAKCDKGLALVKRCQAEWTEGVLPSQERQRRLVLVTQARDLIRDGMASFVEAERKTGKSYDTKVYLEALIVARKMMMTLN